VSESSTVQSSRDDEAMEERQSSTRAFTVGRTARTQFEKFISMWKQSNAKFANYGDSTSNVRDKVI